MLTFESAESDGRLDVHGDKEGLLKLTKIFTDMAEAQPSTHTHLMTDDWGDSSLSTEKQGEENNLYHHVEIFYWS